MPNSIKLFYICNDISGLNAFGVLPYMVLVLKIHSTDFVFAATSEVALCSNLRPKDRTISFVDMPCDQH